MNEKQIVGASYIVNFYRIVDELTTTSVQYFNLLIELEARQKTDKVDVSDRQVLIQAVQILRENIQKAYIMYKSLKGNVDTDFKISDEKEKKFTENFHDTIKTFIIDRDKVQEIVQFLNDFIVGDVVKHLLRTSEDILSEVYSKSVEGGGAA